MRPPPPVEVSSKGPATTPATAKSRKAGNFWIYLPSSTLTGSVANNIVSREKSDSALFAAETEKGRRGGNSRGDRGRRSQTGELFPQLVKANWASDSCIEFSDGYNFSI